MAKSKKGRKAGPGSGGPVRKKPGSTGRGGGRPIVKRVAGAFAVSVVLVAAVFGLRAWLAPRPEPVPPDSAVQDNDPVKGATGGSVTIREFSDFQCPACKNVQTILADVLKSYPDEVKVEYENFPLPSHKWSRLAAQAGECAYEAGKFWEVHDLLFAQQAVWSESPEPTKMFISMASDAGLDEAAFESCLERDTIKELVERDFQEGRSLDVRSTPTFFVNGKKIVGVREREELTKIIDEELKDEE